MTNDETSGERVTVTVAGGVADVRLNRPDKRNAVDDAMFAAIIAAGERLLADRSVRAVVLSGNGGAFCAGLDMAVFAKQAQGEQWRPTGSDSGDDAFGQRGLVLGRGQRAAWVWQAVPAPVIAAVEGPALGIGLQLALGADIRVVAPDASLGALEVKWGIVADSTGTQVLPRLVRMDVAKELLFTGRVVDGEEAVRIGLATRVSTAPRETALELASEIAGNNPAAVRAYKQLLGTAWSQPMTEGFKQERVFMHELIGSDNQREAVRARMERRQPHFDD